MTNCTGPQLGPLCLLHWSISSPTSGRVKATSVIPWYTQAMLAGGCNQTSHIHLPSDFLCLAVCYLTFLFCQIWPMTFSLGDVILTDVSLVATLNGFCMYFPRIMPALWWCHWHRTLLVLGFPAKLCQAADIAIASQHWKSETRSSV